MDEIKSSTWVKVHYCGVTADFAEVCTADMFSVSLVYLSGITHKEVIYFDY